jgi:hypothetical protein
MLHNLVNYLKNFSGEPAVSIQNEKEFLEDGGSS